MAAAGSHHFIDQRPDITGIFILRFSVFQKLMFRRLCRAIFDAFFAML